MASASGAEVAATGPFLASVITDGEETSCRLAHLPLDLLGRCTPVRRPSVYRRQHHMPGRWLSTTAGRFLDYESLLERDWMLLMDFDRRERLLESLPGYTGPNVLARGSDVEADAVYFTHELEAIIGRWVALDYQRRPHRGLRVPEAPHLTLSPNEAYEEAVARAGFLFVPRDPHLHLTLLPVCARVIGRGGVEIGGLSYDSPVLDPYRQRRSPLGELAGKWPFRVDRRDLGHVFFCDPADGRWHELAWRHGRDVQRPFGASALTYVKRLLVGAGVRRPSEEEIATELARLLHDLSDRDLFRDRRARREAVRQAVIAEQRSARRSAPAREEEKEGVAPPPVSDAWADLEIPKLELER